MLIIVNYGNESKMYCYLSDEGDCTYDVLFYHRLVMYQHRLVILEIM